MYLPTRSAGKPYFVTLLLYLDLDWPDTYDAETHFLDLHTGVDEMGSWL